MRDLATTHLANVAEIEEIRPLGPPSKTITFATTIQTANPTSGKVSYQNLSAKNLPDFPVGAAQTVFDIAASVAPKSIKAIKDELSLRLYQGTNPTPPAGHFKFSVGTGPGGVDQIATFDTPTELIITYATTDDYAFSEFLLVGTGLQYTTDVRVGAQSVAGITLLSNTQMKIKVPEGLAPAVIIGNVRAFMATTSSPLTTDILFDIATRSSFATGSKLLMQRFLTILMDPAGANFLALIPKSRSLSPQMRSLIVNRASLAVGITKAKMRRTTPPNSPPDEVLLRAFVDGVDVDSTTGSVEVSVRLVNLAGTSFAAPISLG